jgi:type III secretory pathway component EscT
MLTALVFLQSGGPERVASSLARDVPSVQGAALEVVGVLASGIELAVAVAAPLVAVALVVEVASALFARAANPAFVQPLLAPLRSLAILLALALLLERMVEVLAELTRAWP